MAKQGGSEFAKSSIRRDFRANRTLHSEADGQLAVSRELWRGDRALQMLLRSQSAIFQSRALSRPTLAARASSSPYSDLKAATAASSHAHNQSAGQNPSPLSGNPAQNRPFSSASPSTSAKGSTSASADSVPARPRLYERPTFLQQVLKEKATKQPTAPSLASPSSRNTPKPRPHFSSPDWGVR